MINGLIMTDYLYLGWVGGISGEIHPIGLLIAATSDICNNFGNPMCFQVREDINEKSQ